MSVVVAVICGCLSMKYRRISIFELSKIDKDILTTQIKAYIARNIWNDDGFFPVIHTIDNTFQKAIMQ